MRGTVNPDTLLFDPEIEKTARENRRRTRAQREIPQLLEEEIMADQPPPRRTLGDYATPNAEGCATSIVRPPIQANNFEIKPALLHLVQQEQFGGNSNEDPNSHIASFLQLCDTMKVNGASDDAIRLRLFPFSLRDKAKSWLQSQPQGSIVTWNELVTRFLTKYFPPSKSAKMRQEITSFSQHDGEVLYDAWERFKDLLRRCPHHAIP